MLLLVYLTMERIEKSKYQKYEPTQVKKANCNETAD